MVREVAEVRALREAWRREGRRVGFVPTMGALHAGHISLISHALPHSDALFCSIFVNPTQFGVGEDFDKYPRDVAKDVLAIEQGLSAAAAAQGGGGRDVEAVVFAPSVRELYGDRFSTRVDIGLMADTSEAHARPQFFSGVATVVSKLFNITQPHRAYFGQKDALQCVAVRRLVEDLNFGLEVVVCDTLREADGLAMSSRNVYLSAEERKRAPILYKALCAGRSRYLDGERSAQEIIKATKEALEKGEDWWAAGPPRPEVQYVSIADAGFGHELDYIDPKGPGAFLSTAVRLGSTRLIDNVVLPPL